MSIAGEGPMPKRATPMTTKKSRITFVTCQHPTEGMLLQMTIFAGDPHARTMPWKRCARIDGRRCPPRDAIPPFSQDNFSIEDAGLVEAPLLRVGVAADSLKGTSGSLKDDGIEAWWGGACPVHGEVYVDGVARLIYRARGASWSLGRRIEDADDNWGDPIIFEYSESPYLFPDAGWLSAAESERNIRIGVAEWRKVASAGTRAVVIRVGGGS